MQGIFKSEPYYAGPFNLYSRDGNRHFRMLRRWTKSRPTKKRRAANRQARKSRARNRR